MASSSKARPVTCPFCGLSWLTAETMPLLHCRQCNRDFPNPWAEGLVREMADG